MVWLTDVNRRTRRYCVSKPKVLTGLDQTVCGRHRSASLSGRRHECHRRIGGAYPIMVRARNVVSPSLSPREEGTACRKARSGGGGYRTMEEANADR